ncbi:4'-phosphopantetheinyl transferase superfamily protein [Rhizobium rhizogenes]|uniref:4'-phosphopantetheinyl transferase family protein n=1 Tax=Rhizobium rhizogenes TaxID=359 RepID=UPI002869E550|nr:4'-phosphopantetheinyl transferase superfamily protein [Rhizobium rhizogenes]
MMPGHQISGTNAPVMRDDIAAAVCRSDGFLSGPVFLDTGSKNVVALEAQYHLPCYRPALFDRLEVVMPTLLAEAVPKRQAEFLAGRFLGQAALKLLGRPSVPIGIGNKREPVWPPGISGSISHSHGICVSMATLDGEAMVGVDVEKIEPGAVTEIILKRALDTLERELIADREQCDGRVLPFLVFSAKETLFKALYPIVGRHFDFHAARLFERPDRDELRLELTRPLHRSLPAGSRFHIRFSVTGSFVRTWLICR